MQKCSGLTALLCRCRHNWRTHCRNLGQVCLQKPLRVKTREVHMSIKCAHASWSLKNCSWAWLQGGHTMPMSPLGMLPPGSTSSFCRCTNYSTLSTLAEEGQEWVPAAAAAAAAAQMQGLAPPAPSWRAALTWRKQPMRKSKATCSAQTLVTFKSLSSDQVKAIS